MISILIPVFNFNVVSLVNELNRQLDQSNTPGEILVFDDFSSPPYHQLNSHITRFKNVVYKELDKNYGRSAIRKILASHAKYEWLLFLDSDSCILNNDFIERYISAFSQKFDVYVGGRIYPAEPRECNKKLHWKYGVKRESLKGHRTAFHSNNFCIKKEVFHQIDSTGFLKQYGHEDTWIGIELERLGKCIEYIDNSVEHIQVENTESFFKKTEQALQNLLFLSKAVDKETLARHVSLFKVYIFIKRTRLQFAVNLVWTILKARIFKNLNSCNPSLVFFDFYRLHRLIQISKTNL